MHRTPSFRSQISTLTAGLCFCLSLAFSSELYAGIFNYSELPQKSITTAPHWLEMMGRHIEQDQNKIDCINSGAQQCELYGWYKFLDTLAGLSPREQLERVNLYANKHPYILDINNYGVEDYWAILRQFLTLSGDCEDYSLTKYFSLRRLGFNAEQMRIVALQDTNLRVAHAVLAVDFGGDTLILDNQSQSILSHTEILHYAPLYSVNEKLWWMHLPAY